VSTRAGGARELIRLTGVEKRYGGQLILRIGELVVYEGDRIALVGPNGSGKSTLLRILGGIAPIREGEIWWAPDLMEEALGFVPQGGGLYGELSVKDNLDLRRRLYGLPPADPAAASSTEGLGLGPFLEKPFSKLSGGFQRLAVVASALNVNPTWLFLDEPFAGVDESKAEAITYAVRRLGDRLRILITTGQVAESVPDKNRVIEVRDGQPIEVQTGQDRDGSGGVA
jgi:ABC-type multidrug transport system ATPase subunit